jgi:hypothetical protein
VPRLPRVLAAVLAPPRLTAAPPVILGRLIGLAGAYRDRGPAYGRATDLSTTGTRFRAVVPER